MRPLPHLRIDDARVRGQVSPNDSAVAGSALIRPSKFIVLPPPFCSSGSVDQSRGFVFLFSSGRDLERAVRQWALKFQSLFGGRSHPLFDLGIRRQDDRHGLGMDRADFRIGIAGEKSKQLMLALNWVGFRATPAVPCRPDTREHREWPIVVQRKPRRRFPGLVSAYSQNDVKGTRQRFAGLSQPRQCGLFTLRMFVIGPPPNCGGPGMLQRT